MFHIVYFMKQIFTALILVLLIVLQSAGQVLCCLRTCGAGVGLETGKSTVAYPVDAKVDKAIDEIYETWPKADKAVRAAGAVTPDL